MAGISFATYAALATTAVSAGTAIYSASQQGGKASLPKAPVVPKLPETKSVAANAQEADLRARSAGGTILSDQASNKAQVGDGANATRKTLLGT